MRTNWMIENADALKAAALERRNRGLGGPKWNAQRAPDGRDGTWERLTAETWADWRGACRKAVETFRNAVQAEPSPLLAPGETAEQWDGLL